MSISERHSDDQLIDRERILEEFTPQNLRLEGQSTLSPDWLSRYIDRLHRTLEDPRFLVLPTSCQLLYVHLLKLTHGIGQSEIAISIDGLTDKTKRVLWCPERLLVNGSRVSILWHGYR